MKLGVIPSHGAIYGMVDHLNKVQLGDEDVDAVIVENVHTPIVDGVKYVNTSVGIQNFIISDEIRNAYYKEMDADINSKEVSAIYALYNGEKFSDWLEVSYSSRLMNNEVGPKVGFITGTGMKVQAPVKEAIKGMRMVEQLLQDAGYVGEVYVGLSKDFRITSLKFGHLYACFAMFYEVCKDRRRDSIVNFLLGETNECELAQQIVVSNVVSRAPFPTQVPYEQKNITMPSHLNADKHIWRVHNGMTKYALVVAQGDYLLEARRRLRRTVTNLSKYDRDLQYRTDYGLRMKFVLSQEEYNTSAKREWKKR